MGGPRDGKGRARCVLQITVRGSVLMSWCVSPMQMRRKTTCGPGTRRAELEKETGRLRTTCSAVTGAVSATSHSARSHMSVHLVYVVHVSRTPAVLRCALSLRVACYAYHTFKHPFTHQGHVPRTLKSQALRKVFVRLWFGLEHGVAGYLHGAVTSKQPLLQWGMVMVKSSLPNRRLSAKQRVNRSHAISKPVYALGSNVGKNNTKLNSCDPFCRESHSRGHEEPWTCEGGTESSRYLPHGDEGHLLLAQHNEQSSTRSRADGPRMTS